MKGKEKTKKEKRARKRESTGKKGGFKDAKLVTKLCIISGVVLFVCMMSSNLFSASRMANEMNQEIDKQFNMLCDQNILKIESVFTECAEIANTINHEMAVVFDTRAAGLAGEADQVSAVTGEAITREQKNAENIILNTIWAGLEGHANLEGIGVFFEPYTFSPAIQHYGPYGVKADISNGYIENFTYDRYETRPYYTEAKDGNMSFMDAYVDTNGTLMFSAGYPIMYQGQFKGIVLLDITADIFSMLDETDEEYPSMYIDLIRSNQNVLYSTKQDTITMNLKDLMDSDSYSALTANMSGTSRFHVATNNNGDEFMHYAAPIEIGGERWWVMTSLLQDEYTAAVDSIRLTTNILSFVTIALVIILIAFVLRKMLKPLEEIEAAANAMADGSLNVKINYESGDEVGSVAHSMRAMMKRTNAVIQDLIGILDELANENFRVEMTNKDLYIGDYAPMVPAVEGIIAKLSHALINIKIAADQVGHGAEQVASAAQDLSQGSTEQAATVQELSRSMEQISDETKVTANKAEQANDISNRMGSEVIRSNEKMREMSEAMMDITNKSNEIEKIIKTIDDIAFQTNILALNAAVEAARAGSAGKGFAVVADEVRNLAQKSAEAAKNTTVLIEGTIQSVANGGRLTEETAEALQMVADNVNQVARLIHEISVASNEQAESISRTTNGIEQISAVIQTNSATAEECAATSEELSGQVAIMNNMVSRFKLKDR